MLRGDGDNSSYLDGSAELGDDLPCVRYLWPSQAHPLCSLRVKPVIPIALSLLLCRDSCVLLTDARIDCICHLTACLPNKVQTAGRYAPRSATLPGRTEIDVFAEVLLCETVVKPSGARAGEFQLWRVNLQQEGVSRVGGRVSTKWSAKWARWRVGVVGLSETGQARSGTLSLRSVDGWCHRNQPTTHPPTHSPPNEARPRSNSPTHLLPRCHRPAPTH